MFRQSVLSPGNALIALLAALAIGVVVANHAHADPVRVTPSVTVSQRYESNVFYDDRKKESDLITSIDPRLSFDREGERSHTRIWAGLNTRTYMDFDELNAVDRLVGWDLDQRLGTRFSVF